MLTLKPRCCIGPRVTFEGLDLKEFCIHVTQDNYG